MSVDWASDTVLAFTIITGGERFIQNIVLKGIKAGQRVFIMALVRLEGLAAATTQTLRIRRGGSGLGGAAITTQDYLVEATANSRLLAAFAIDNAAVDDQEYSVSGTSIGANQIAREATLTASRA